MPCVSFLDLSTTVDTKIQDLPVKDLDSPWVDEAMSGYDN